MGIKGGSPPYMAILYFRTGHPFTQPFFVGGGFSSKWVLSFCKLSYGFVTEIRCGNLNENCPKTMSRQTDRLVRRNPQKSLEILRKPQKSLENLRNPQKSLEILRNPQKSLEIIRNPQKSLENLRNPQKSLEKQQKSLEILRKPQKTL